MSAPDQAKALKDLAGRIEDNTDAGIAWMGAEKIESLRESLTTAVLEMSRCAAEAGFLRGIMPSATGPIDMQDVRLCIGEGKLSGADVLAGVNAVLRQRRAKLESMIHAELESRGLITFEEPK